MMKSSMACSAAQRLDALSLFSVSIVILYYSMPVVGYAVKQNHVRDVQKPDAGNDGAVIGLAIQLVIVGVTCALILLLIWYFRRSFNDIWKRADSLMPVTSHHPSSPVATSSIGDNAPPIAPHLKPGHLGRGTMGNSTLYASPTIPLPIATRARA